MPMTGVREPAVSRATRNIVPSPPKTISKSTSRVSAPALGQVGALSPASAAVAASVITLRPAARIREAAWRPSGRLETLSELASSPTRLICSASFFKQRQKFPVARRSEQGRLSHSAPMQTRDGADELLEFAQHAL